MAMPESPPPMIMTGTIWFESSVPDIAMMKVRLSVLQCLIGAIAGGLSTAAASPELTREAHQVLIPTPLLSNYKIAAIIPKLPSGTTHDT